MLANTTCAGFPAQALTYYVCPSGADADAAETVAQVSDLRCEGEERVKDCHVDAVEADVAGDVGQNVYGSSVSRRTLL